MIESSLYGMTTKIFEWEHKKLIIEEIIYADGNKKLFIHRNKHFDGVDHRKIKNQNFIENLISQMKEELNILNEDEGFNLMKKEEINDTYVFYRDYPDRNKNRTVISMKTGEIKIQGGIENVLEKTGFKIISRKLLEVIKYQRNGYLIELSKETETENINLNYLVKAYLLSEDANQGEKLLNQVINELSEKIKLIKPPLNWF